MTRKALILGITGNIGNACAEAFQQHGWQVHALHRAPASAKAKIAKPDAITWHTGDAMNANHVRQAAEGAAVILHAVNPPAYKNWRGLALPMLDHTIAAAKATGARILFPGNVYPYGPDAWPLVAEDAPQNPVSRKGAIRVEMENTLMASGAKCLILRAGDFFGDANQSSWFSAVVVKPGKPVKRIIYPGKPDAGHAWAYLPDLAETFVRLAEREQALPDFDIFHFGGYYLEHGADLVDAIRHAADAPNAKQSGLPWWLLRLIAPFNETMREIQEMRYLWDNSLQLDNRKLVAFLGSEPHRPLNQALRETLGRMGCVAK